MQAYFVFVASLAAPGAHFFHQRDRLARGFATFFGGSRFQEQNMGDHAFDLTRDGLRGRFLSTSAAPPEGPQRSTAITQLADIFRTYATDDVVRFQLRWWVAWGQI